MRVQVTRLPRPNVAQDVEVEAGTRLMGLLGQLAIPPDAVVVIRQERPIPLDAPLAEGDELRVVNVFSGG